MKRYLLAVAGGAAGAAAFIFGLWVLALPAATRLAEGHPGLASWVQAIGALAALAALFIAQRMDHWNARQTRIAEDERLGIEEAERLNMIIAQARVTLDHCQERSQRGGWSDATTGYSAAQLQADLRLMEGVDIRRLPGRFVVAVYFKTRQALIAAAHQVELVRVALPAQPSPAFFDAARTIVIEAVADLAPWVPERR